MIGGHKMLWGRTCANRPAPCPHPGKEGYEMAHCTAVSSITPIGGVL